MNDKSLIPVERIEASIYRIRGENVMLDRDLENFIGFRQACLIRQSSATATDFQLILCFN